MASKKIKVQVGLDFTANDLTIEKIRDQMDSVFKAMKINLDPAEYKKVEAQLKKLGELAEDSLNQSTGKMNFKRLDGAITNNHEVIHSFDKLTATMKKGGVVGDETFNKITTANEHFKKGLVESNGLLSKMGTTLMNTIRWNISASAINAVTGELQRAYGFAKDLDRSLTNIRIVSGQSAANMVRFSQEANKASQELKVSTIDYADAALLFYQQGLSAIEVQNMTRAAIIGGNITGESTAEMSNLLTAVLNGYKIATEDVITVTDKLAAVGAETAADFHELATAMSKVASMANAAGVPLDSLNAQIATIVSVTRESPESIGTSLKTIYGRMLMFKTDTEALMKDDDGEVFGAPKVEEALQAYNRVAGAQISLFKTTKDGKRELRDLGEVIEEIGNSWDTVTDKTAKFGLATALAGSRQQNRLVALFDSWDMYKEAVTTSLEAEGTSLLQNQIYMDSYDAKLKGLQATKEELYMSLTNTDGLKNLVDALTSIMKTVTKISEVTGGLNIVFGMVAATLAQSGIDKIANMTMPSFSVGAGKGDPSTEELKTGEQLLVIERAYGKEKAETHRLAMKAAIENKALMLERKDILAEEGTLLDNIEKIQTSNETQAYKDRAIASLIEENQHLSITEREILNIQKAYSALEHERANLKVLMEEAGGEAASEVLQAKIDASREAIVDMENAINEIHNANTSERQRAVKSVKLTEKIEQDEIRKINELEAAARKTTTATVALQTGLMMLPSVIGVVGDSSKTTGDVLKTIGATTIPALTSGLMKSIPAMVGAAGAGTSIGAAMLPVIGPILAVAGAIGALAVVAKKFAEQNISFKDAFGNLEGVSNELEQVKAGYDTLSQKLVDIATRLREINTIQREGGLTVADSEALDKEAAALERKRTELEQQLAIENLLISATEKKLELAAREAAEAKMKSEYSQGIGDRVTVEEELERSIEAYKVAGLMVKSYQRDIAALDTESKTYEKDLAKLTASMEKQEGIRNTAKQNVALHSAAIKKIIADLETEDGANKDLIESLEGVLEAGLAVAEADLAVSGAVAQLTDDIIGNTEAVDANRIAQEEKDEAMQNLIDAYDEVTNKIKTYNDYLYELNTSEELSAKTKQEIILKHAELAPYIENEQELRKQLIKLIEAEERAQIDAYVLMMMSSEEFFNAKLKGNKDLADELRKAYDIELDDFKSLAKAKAKVEETLIAGLSGHWAQYYDTQSKGLVFTQEQWENMTEEQQKEYGLYRYQLREVANRFEGITLDLAPIDLKKINTGLSGASKGGKGSSSTEDSGQFLDSIDAEIRAIKIRNDNLIKTSNLLKEQIDLAKDIEGIEGLNEQYRLTGELIEHNKEKIIESFEEEQDLVHKRANDIREQYSQYNIDSWFDANGEQTLDYIDQYNSATKDQKKEMALVFGWVQKLKKAWMDADVEVKKVLESNKELAKEMDKLIEQQKEMARVAWVEEQNDLYDQQQDKLKSLESIQEKIVAIIRKRGEEEKKALDESHRAEMESLEERHKERKEKYQDDLDSFRKLIQGKIDALDEQSDEEDYQEQLDKEREEANRLQREIDVLSLDDSLTARNKTIELRKQLADQNDKIAKMQQKKERNELKKSLQDQIKQEEDKTKKLEEIADTEYENDKKRYENDYKDHKEYLEWKYSDEQVYSEARQALLDGEVEVAKGKFVELQEAFETFEKKFGKGMGVLGDSIKQNLTKELGKAREAMDELAGRTGIINVDKILPQYDSGYQPKEGEKGFVSPKTPKTEEDYSKMYFEARDKGDWQTMEYANRQANILRKVGDVVTATVDIEAIKKKYGSSFKDGGEVLSSGLMLTEFHGTKNDPEWILNSPQLQKVLKDTVLSTMNIAMPKMPKMPDTVAKQTVLQIDNLINVEGNVTKESIPLIKTAGNDIIETIKELNKSGVFRPPRR